MKPALAVLSVLILAACGDAAVPTSEENRQLEEAERMLNEAPADLEAIEENALLEGNGPAAAEEPS